jgi:hypothetical protein
MASPRSQLPAHGHQADIQASYKQGRLTGFVMGVGTVIAVVVAWTYMWWLVVAGALGAGAWFGFRAWAKSKKGADNAEK